MLGRDVALEPVLEVRRRRVQVREVQGRGAAGGGGGGGRRVGGVVRARGVGEEEGLAGEGAPEEGPQAVGEDEEEALVEEPLLVLGEGVLEEGEVAAADGLGERVEDGGEGGGLRAGEEELRGEAAEEQVAGDEVAEDEASVGLQGGRDLEVGLLEAEGGAEEVAVGEVETAEVVEEVDALGGRVVGQRRGVCGDVCEDLLREVAPPALGWKASAKTCVILEDAER